VTKLIIDVGNTNIKFGFFNHDKLINVITNPTKEYSRLQLTTILKTYQYDEVYVGSVVKELTNKLLNDLEFITKCKINLIKPEHFKFVFDLSKFPMNEIGVDILAIALITKHLYRQGIGISFGTATFAVVVNEKQILGVAIAPSIELGTRHLETTTSLIKKVNTTIGNLSLGKNTKTSLQSGGSHMARGFVMSLLEHVNSHYKINKILITGGKTNLLKFIAKIPHTQILDHAVLLGYYELVKTI
jgi:type III pantothenate kinase